MKLKSFGLSIPIKESDLIDPEVIRFFQNAARARQAQLDKIARFALGCPTKEDLRELEESSKYCHECGRKHDET